MANAWADLPCVVVASGPSLTEGDCQAVVQARAADRCRVIVVNDNWRRVPNADALYAADTEWWRCNTAALQSCGAARYTASDEANDFGAYFVHVVDDPGLGRLPNILHSGRNSGYQAINLAYQFGARRILLLGYDMQLTGGRAHWFGDHPAPLRPPRDFANWAGRFRQLASDLEAEGVEVRNCTRETALDCFARSTIDVELDTDVAEAHDQVTVYVNRSERTSPRFGAMFARGCGAHVVDDDDARPGAWAGFGSPARWASLTACRKAGRPWYYGDHGYFDRGKRYRITRDAFQHDGVGQPDYTRLPRAPRPWRTWGNHVLVCPPDDKIAALRGFDAVAWRADVASRLRANTDREIRWRERNANQPLEADLEGAWALVTWASNTAVDALMAGVPVICTMDCAASSMGLSDPVNIEYPRYPDNRDEWAAVLAANQWTMQEIASGMAWSQLNAV